MVSFLTDTVVCGFSLYHILAYFLIYSCIGWCLEVIYAAATTGQLVNRGFLNGPVCPIYGFGMIIVLFALTPLQHSILLLYIGGVILPSALELVGGWALYKIYHTRWWDYSDFPFNIGGYICLEFCLLWGVGTLVVMRIVHPVVADLVDLIPPFVGVILMCFLYAVYAVDVVATAIAASALADTLDTMEQLGDSIHAVSDAMTQLLGTTTLNADQKLDEQRLQLKLAAAEAREAAPKKRALRETLAAVRAKTEEAREAAHNIGYPVLVRPSYVLGGRGMEIVYDDAQLRKYVDRALKEAQADTVVSGRLPSPLLIDKFLQDAVEIDVDALFDGEELYIGGIMEHVEEAGVHSGDAACTLPPSTLSDDQIRRLREGTYAIAKGCGVQGLINVQYAFMANTLYVIEANPRASRTVPFASKATGVALAKAAARIMVGETIQQQRDNGLLLPHGDGGDIHRGQQVAVKESVLPFKRFRTPLGKTVDVLLGPEMRSTGEVMGFDRDFPHAFAKSQLAAYEGGLPTSGNVFISVNDTDKRQLPLFAARLVELGFNIWATEGTASVLRRYGIDSKIVDKISVRMDSDPDDPITTYHAEGSVGKNVVQLIEEGAIDLILNTPNSRGSRSDGYAIRSAAIAADLPQFTTMTEFSAVLMAIEAVRNNDYQIMSIQDHSTQLFELESRD